MIEQPLTRMQAMTTAKRMYEGGWGISEIRHYLRKHGVQTSWARVKVWADPEYAEEYRRRERERSRLKNRKKNGVKTFRVLDEDAKRQLRETLEIPVPTPIGTLTPDLLLALRLEDGLPYSVIAKVANRFLGADLTEQQVRYRLLELGAPKDEKKAANARAQARRRQMRVAA